MVSITLCNAKTSKSAAGIDQDCFYQLPYVICFSVPSV